jgi:kumamolisin
MAAQVEYVPLKGSRRYTRSGSVVLGRANENEWCEVTLSARRKAPLPEPVPQKLIRRADLMAKYGADVNDLDAIEKVFSSHGATVVSKNVEAHTVEIAGPVSGMEKLFNVHLVQSRHDDVVYRSRVVEIHLPTELANLVTGVFGLDSRPMIKRRNPLGLNATHTLPPPNQRGWYLPSKLADAYKFPAGDGADQTIAILECGGQVAVCVSTGDDGSDDQNSDGMAHVSFPAASPYVGAVGGTSLVRATD